MSKLISFLLLLTFITLTSCEKQKEEIPPMTNIELTVAQKSLVHAGNSFAFKLLKYINAVENTKDQYFFSPYCIAEALSMTLNGADGSTADSIRAVLNYQGMNLDEINEYCMKLSTEIISIDPMVTLDMGNSIWYDKGYSILPEFIQTNQTYFNAGVESLDFSSPNTVATINQWISNTTGGKIQNMINDIPGDIVMYLINALYFKGQWTSRFDNSLTKEAYFYYTPGDSVPVEMMHQNLSFNYTSDEIAQVAELPYGQQNFAMVVILPYDGISSDIVIESITPERWESWEKSFTGEKLILSLPKLKFSYGLELSEILKKMGMANAFNERADFSKITSTSHLYIGRVQHHTFVEVNENGTEASAATSVGFYDVSNRINPEIEFCVNKPFLFAIRERSTGAILFLGRVNQVSNDSN